VGSEFVQNVAQKFPLSIPNRLLRDLEALALKKGSTIGFSEVPLQRCALVPYLFLHLFGTRLQDSSILFLLCLQESSILFPLKSILFPLKGNLLPKLLL
jgi:hypothetical protein